MVQLSRHIMAIKQQQTQEQHFTLE